MKRRISEALLINRISRVEVYFYQRRGIMNKYVTKYSIKTFWNYGSIVCIFYLIIIFCHLM